MSTIYALSSGAGRSAIAVIRISGPQSMAFVQQLAGPLPQPRFASLRNLRNPRTRQILDTALVLCFPSPTSFTGEDCAEFHIHGGRAVTRAVLEALHAVGGKPAEPGEFTRRAFLNGKMDLTAVEGLSDLIEAETELQRRQALNSLTASLGQRAETWRSQLIQSLALVEAMIDFSEEEDVPASLWDEIIPQLTSLTQEIRLILIHAQQGLLIRDGLTIVIAGPPNAGKSTLMNALAGRDVSIVSERAGTTRDVIEVHLDLGGIPVILVDTAGVHATEDPIEKEGIRRALARAHAAHLILWLRPAGEEENAPPFSSNLPVISLFTKADINWPPPPNPAGESTPPLAISAKTGAGIPALLETLRAYVEDKIGEGEPALVTRERHRVALQIALEALEPLLARSPPLPIDSSGPADSPWPIEIVAEHLHIAARALLAIVGKIDVEMLLDDIFSRFCIGK